MGLCPKPRRLLKKAGENFMFAFFVDFLMNSASASTAEVFLFQISQLVYNYLLDNRGEEW